MSTLLSVLSPLERKVLSFSCVREVLMLPRLQQGAVAEPRQSGWKAVLLYFSSGTSRVLSSVYSRGFKDCNTALVCFLREPWSTFVHCLREKTIAII